jgi:hypothetical protein
MPHASMYDRVNRRQSVDTVGHQTYEGDNQWIGWPSDLKEGGHVARIHNSRLAQREALR